MEAKNSVACSDYDKRAYKSFSTVNFDQDRCAKPASIWRTYAKEINECVFPHLRVRTAVNHNKNPPDYLCSEQNSATNIQILVPFAPLLIFVWPLEFHIWTLRSGVAGSLITVKVQRFTGPHWESNRLRSINRKSLNNVQRFSAQIVRTRPSLECVVQLRRCRGPTHARSHLLRNI